MAKRRTVNEVLDLLSQLDGQAVEVEGILGIEPEGYELLHYPKAERRPNEPEGPPFYRSSFWLVFGYGSIQPNDRVLNCWRGKRVRVHGVVRAPASRGESGHFGKGGCGPCDGWPAQIEPYSIQRVTAEERRENIDQGQAMKNE